MARKYQKSDTYSLSNTFLTYILAQILRLRQRQQCLHQNIKNHQTGGFQHITESALSTNASSSTLKAVFQNLNSCISNTKDCVLGHKTQLLAIQETVFCKQVRGKQAQKNDFQHQAVVISRKSRDV